MSGLDFLPAWTDKPLGIAIDPQAPPLGLTLIAPARNLDDLARVADALIDSGDPGRDPGDEDDLDDHRHRMAILMHRDVIDWSRMSVADRAIANEYGP